MTTEKENEVKALTESIASIRKEHVNELKEIEQKWKTVLQQRSDRLEAKHEEEIKELTREWRNERKVQIYICFSFIQFKIFTNLLLKVI